MNDNLIRLGLLDEDDIILDEAALSLALLDHPDADPTPYRALIEAVSQRLETVGRGAGTAERARRCPVGSSGRGVRLRRRPGNL